MSLEELELVHSAALQKISEALNIEEGVKDALRALHHVANVDVLRSSLDLDRGVAEALRVAEDVMDDFVSGDSSLTSPSSEGEGESLPGPRSSRENRTPLQEVLRQLQYLRHSVNGLTCEAHSKELLQARTVLSDLSVRLEERSISRRQAEALLLRADRALHIWENQALSDGDKPMLAVSYRRLMRLNQALARLFDSAYEDGFAPTDWR